MQDGEYSVAGQSNNNTMRTVLIIGAIILLLICCCCTIFSFGTTAVMWDEISRELGVFHLTADALNLMS